MTDDVNFADLLQADGEPLPREWPARMAQGHGRDMDGALKVGEEVRVTSALIPDCKPGDKGTVVLATLLGDGRWLYHVRLHSPRAGGVKCFYRDEVGTAG
jgi:hypothetical protein